MPAYVIAKNGGRLLSRGGETAVLEGGWRPNRVVIQDVPDMANAKACVASERDATRQFIGVAI